MGKVEARYQASELNADSFWQRDLPLQLILVSVAMYAALWIAAEVLR